jgi:hypothetical protein
MLFCRAAASDVGAVNALSTAAHAFHDLSSP